MVRKHLFYNTFEHPPLKFGGENAAPRQIWGYGLSGPHLALSPQGSNQEIEARKIRGWGAGAPVPNKPLTSLGPEPELATGTAETAFQEPRAEPRCVPPCIANLVTHAIAIKNR